MGPISLRLTGFGFNRRLNNKDEIKALGAGNNK
jgi:hypothetical protein